MVVIVTSQPVAGRGAISLKEAKRINQLVVDEVTARGRRIDASYMSSTTEAKGGCAESPSPARCYKLQRNSIWI